MAQRGTLAETPLDQLLVSLAERKVSGLLRINAADGQHFLEFQDGIISAAARTTDRNPLGELLIARGLITEDQLKQAIAQQRSSAPNRLLGEIMLETGMVSLDGLETALKFQIEEEIFDVFEINQGDYEVLQGASLDLRLNPARGLVRILIDVAALVVEARRRNTEWDAIRTRVPHNGCLLKLTAQGRETLFGHQGVSAEGQAVLRQVSLVRSVELVARRSCLGRFNSFNMLVELADAGLIEPALPEEVLGAAESAVESKEVHEALRLAGFAEQFFPSPYKEHATTNHHGSTQAAAATGLDGTAPSLPARRR